MGNPLTNIGFLIWLAIVLVMVAALVLLILSG